MVTTTTPERAAPTAGYLVAAALTLAIIALSFSSVFISYLAQAQVAPLAIAFYRTAFAMLLLLPATLVGKRRELASLSRKELLLIAGSGAFLAIHFGAWISSLNYLPISTSVILVNTHPLFVVFASWLFLKERPTRRVLLGTAIGFVGMLIISKDGLSDLAFAFKGQLLAVIGALAVVGYFIIGRAVRSRVSLLAYVVPMYAICAALLLFWSLVADSHLYPYRASVWALFLALAVVPTILGHTVFNWAIKHVRPSTISLTFLGEPVVASILAFLFFSQTPPVETYVGGAFVLGGVYLTMQTPK